MILESLVLELFKRHVNIEITFSETLTVIRGANYKGKSSLLEGLFFCLFGTSAIIGNKDQITTKGHKGKASAQLVFTHGGSRYYINRTLSTASLNRQLEDESWTTVATGHTSVNDAMVEMIGQDRERTLLLSYSRQGETAALATWGETKLNALVEKVSGAVYADQLISKALERVKTAEAEFDAVGPDPEVPLEQMELDLETCKEAVALAKAEVEKWAALEAETNAQYLAAITDRLEVLTHNKKADEYEKNRTQLQLSYASTEGSIATWEQQEQTAEQPADSHELNLRLQGAVGTAQNIETENTTRQSQLTKRQSAADWISEFEPKYLLAEETVLPELAKLEEALEKASADQTEISNQISSINTTITQLTVSMSEGVCPACNRPYAGHDDNHQIETEEKLTEAERAYEQLKPKSAAAKAVVADLTKQIKDKQRSLPPSDWRTTLQEKQQIISACNQKLATLPVFSPEYLPNLQAEIAELRAQIKRNNTVKTAWNELQQHLESGRKNLNRIRAALSALEVVERIDIAPYAQKVDTLAAELQERAGAAKDSKAVLAEKEAQVVATIRLIDRERGRLLKRRTAEHRKARFSGLAKWLRDNKTAFLAETWDQMMTLVSEFAAQITDGAIEKVVRTDDGSFVYVENGFEQPLTLASGCQKSVIGTGIRIALDAVLSAGLGFIVLDEPSSDMDEHHAAALAGALRAQSRQVILVTHREGEEFSSDQLHILE